MSKFVYFPWLFFNSIHFKFHIINNSASYYPFQTDLDKCIQFYIKHYSTDRLLLFLKQDCNYIKNVNYAIVGPIMPITYLYEYYNINLQGGTTNNKENINDIKSMLLSLMDKGK